jgi:mannose-6-phosphate isomerase-like protein (cupin superfamily)
MSMTVIGPAQGKSVSFGGLGVRFLIGGEQTDGRFALVEHPIAPRALAAPMHVHEHEDEYMFVLEGRVGVRIGDEERVAGPGDLVFKPRGVPHAFWNAGDEPARALELISPAGFEEYFAEIAPLLPPNVEEPQYGELADVRNRYGLDMDLGSIPDLVERHGLPVG